MKRLLFKKQMIEAILSGRKTQTRRKAGSTRLAAGDVVACIANRFMRAADAPVRIRVTGVRRERLWDMPDMAGVSEGFESRREFQRFWCAMYRDKPGMRLVDNPLLDVIEFEVVP